MREISKNTRRKNRRYIAFATLMEHLLMNLEVQQTRTDTAYFRLFECRGMTWFLPVGKSISENALLKQTYEILQGSMGVMDCTFQEFLADLRAYPKLYAVSCVEPKGTVQELVEEGFRE
jgi:hypothetical protein